MPAELAWLALVLGLVVLAAAFVLPREIGKEDEPVLPVHVDLPSMEALAERVRAARLPFRRATNGSRRLAAAPAPSAVPEPPAPEPPQAMGAPQPVLTQATPASFALPVDQL